jgi:uncharacterized membrane protein YdjX (TVP38/TMEM64 family)
MVAELIDTLAGDPARAFLLMVLATATPIPAEAAALVVALRHALLPAFLIIWSGAMAGALLVYALVAALPPRPGLWDRWPAVAIARDRLRNAGWLGILGLRLVPLVPFLAISLAAGLLRLPLGAFLAGTALGIVPATGAVALLGHGLIAKEAATAAASLGLALGLLLLMLVLRRRVRPPSPPPVASPPLSAPPKARSSGRSAPRPGDTL